MNQTANPAVSHSVRTYAHLPPLIRIYMMTHANAGIQCLKAKGLGPCSAAICAADLAVDPLEPRFHRI